MPAQVYVSARTALHPAGDPIENVHVALHEEAGDFLQEGTTDAAGQVFLGNRNADTYEIRITPPKPAKVQDKANRQSIVVVDSADPLVFDIVVDTTTLPPAVDSNMCRMSGYFVNDTGTAAKGVTVTFSATDYSPNLLRDTGADTSYAITGESVSVTTDTEGYGVIDLPRTQRYYVQLSTYPNMGWEVLIPDLSASALPDVVFPKPQTIEYRDADGVLLEPVDAPTVLVNQDSFTILDVVVVHRSGLRVTGLTGLGLQGDDFYWRAEVVAAEGKITITGVAPGNVVFSPADPVTAAAGYDVRVFPEPDYVGALTVTVIDDPDVPDPPPPEGEDDIVIPPIILDGGQF